MRRKCGACTACCTVMEVRALDKPENQKCTHECAQGCEVYSARPRPCRTYRCEWINGKFELGDRPDLIGVIIDDGGGPAFTETWGKDAVTVREVTVQASESGRAEELINSLVESGTTVFLRAKEGASRLLCSTDHGEMRFRRKLEALEKPWNLVGGWHETTAGYEARAATGEHVEFCQSDRAWLMKVNGELQ